MINIVIYDVNGIPVKASSFDSEHHQAEAISRTVAGQFYGYIPEINWPQRVWVKNLLPIDTSTWVNGSTSPMNPITPNEP